MGLKAVANLGSGGGGGGVSGSGTPGTIPIWNTTTALSDSPLSFATSTLTYSSAVTTQTFAATQTWTLPNNAFAFAVGGTGNATLKLDTNNRYVGIDSPSTPADKLHLAGSGALALRMQNVTAGTYWQHKVDGSGNWGLAVNGGTNALTVLSANGNLGVGTASPYTRAEINYGTLITVNGTTPNTTTSLTLSANDPGATAGGNGVLMQMRPITNRGAVVAIGALNGDGNKDANGALTFYYNSANGQIAEGMRLNSLGNVGIGTPSPGRKLEISSSAPLRMGTGGEYFDFLQFTPGTWAWLSSAGSYTSSMKTNGEFQFNSGYGSSAAAYGCRAWVNFNGTGVVAIRASGNVSSITDNGVGDYTVNLTTSMPDANYEITANVGHPLPGPPGGPMISPVNNARGIPTTSLYHIYTLTSTFATTDATYVYSSIHR